MKRVAIAAMMIALLPASAYAQNAKGPATVRTEKQKKEDAEIDQAYRDAIKSRQGNGQAAKIDPWQTIRPAGADSTKH